VIYPLVEDSEKIDAKSVKAEFERLKTVLPQARLGLLHGQLKGDEKEQVMADFRSGKIQVLLATSVVEVGVDVPNATIMLIENAERFGLAQLHQLRGRIGRGEHPSYCVLVASRKASRAGNGSRSWRIPVTASASPRRISRFAAGNIFGTEQSGLPPLRFASLERDFNLLTDARVGADRLMKEDPR